MQSHARDIRDALLFSAPFLLVYLAFLVAPIFYGIFLSLHEWNILSGKSFVGVKNFADALRDQMFRSSFLHTCQFVLLSTPSIVVAGFCMALIVVSKSRLNKAAEALFFSPYVFSITVVGTLWGWLFQKNYGLINQVLNSFGSPGVGWLTDPVIAMGSIVVATLWWTAGFNMVLFVAGIRQIPDDIYEAAHLDGATNLQVLTRITLPLLRDTTVLVVILQIVASFKVFGQVYVMTGGGPYGTTRVLVQYVYEAAFTYFKMGYASAMSLYLFLIILAVSVLQYVAYRNRRR